MTVHVQAVHLGFKPYVCSECPFGFYKKRDFLKHFKKVHEGKESMNIEPFGQKHDLNAKIINECVTPVDEKQLLKCTLFNTELSIDMKNHLLSNHAMMKTLFCAMCDSRFKVKIKLKQHIELVHGKKVPLDSL